MRGHPGALIELLLPLVYSSYLARSKLHPFIIDPIGRTCWFGCQTFHNLKRKVAKNLILVEILECHCVLISPLML